MSATRAELYTRLPLLREDDWWLQLARSAPDGRVLELGAGAGRLTAAFAAAGLEVTAVERDPSMLARLRARVDDRVAVVEADVTALPELEPAGVVVLAASLLNELPDPAARRAVLAGAARSLRRDGELAVHLLGPWWLVRLAGRVTGRVYPLDGSAPVTVEIEAGPFDPWRGRRYATLTYLLPDGTVLVDELDAAVVTPGELVDTFGASGLTVVERFGAMPGEPASPDSPALHLRCRFREGA